MNGGLTLVLALLGVCVFFFVINKPRLDIVALLALVVLPLLGIVSFPDALRGFSDPSIILIALMFVVGEGLVRTGVSHGVGDWILKKASGSETKLLVFLMVSVAVIGSVMSSTGIVAIFIPIVLSISAQLKISPSKLMMPLSFAGLISGMMSLVATPPNMIMNGALVQEGFKGFNFFSFTPIGLIVLVAGVLYMLYARRFLDNAPKESAKKLAARASVADYAREYALFDREAVFYVGEKSPIVGKLLRDLSMHADYSANIICIERGRGLSRCLIDPGASTQIHAGDYMLVNFRDIALIDKMASDLGLAKKDLHDGHFAGASMEIGMVEVMIAPGSSLIGKTSIESKFRTQYGMNIIGIRRDSKPIEGDLINEKFKVSDTLLLIGPWKSARQLQGATNDFVLLNLPADIDRAIAAPGRAPYALASLAVMVALMISGAIPNAMAAFIGCLLMVFTKCIDMESAYKSIAWPSIILIVGMMPFATALENTGGIKIAADALLGAFGGMGPRIVLAALLCFTMVTGLFISNTVTAVLLAPLAITAAKMLEVSPYPFAMAVAIGASAAFMTPISSPVNTLVLEPGKYKFFDFVKIGVPFCFIVLAIGTIFIPIFFPF